MARAKKPAELVEIIPLDQLDNYKEDFGDLKELHDVLRDNYVCFTFYKKDGSLRKAVATRNVSKLEHEGVKVPIPYGGGASALAFFDLEQLQWRSISYNRRNRPRVTIIDMYDNVQDLIDYCGDEYDLSLLDAETQEQPEA